MSFYGSMSPACHTMKLYYHYQILIKINMIFNVFNDRVVGVAQLLELPHLLEVLEAMMLTKRTMLMKKLMKNPN